MGPREGKMLASYILQRANGLGEKKNPSELQVNFKKTKNPVEK